MRTPFCFASACFSPEGVFFPTCFRCAIGKVFIVLASGNKQPYPQRVCVVCVCVFVDGGCSFVGSLWAYLANISLPFPFALAVIVHEEFPDSIGPDVWTVFDILCSAANMHMYTLYIYMYMCVQCID